MTGNRFRFLFVFQFELFVFAEILMATACSSPQPNDRNGNDAGLEDTDLPWDSGTDTDVLVLEPVLLTDFQSNEIHGYPAAAFDGGHIAVSCSDVRGVEDDIESTLFLSFPWYSPMDTMMNIFPQQPPACAGGYLGPGPNSIPFPHPDGFLLLTAASDLESSDCEVVQTKWNANANLLDGPNSFSGLFSGDTLPAMDPNGIADPGGSGTVITGTISGSNLLSEEGTIAVDIDYWREGADHFRLVHLTYPWPWQHDSDEHSSRDFPSCISGQTIFLRDGVLTVLGVEGSVVASAPPYAEMHPVIARVDTMGNVLQEPSYVEDDVPPVPSGLEDTTYKAIVPSFAANGEAILELANVDYLGLDDYLEGYDATIDDPLPIGLWSRTMDYDGAPLSDWIQLADFQSNVQSNMTYGVTWSGRYFGLCYNEPFDTFKLIAMNSAGEPVAPPVDLFWEIPPVEDQSLPCDLVAIDEDTFIAILAVYAEPEQAYRNGLWATRVDVNIPIE